MKRTREMQLFFERKKNELKKSYKNSGVTVVTENIEAEEFFITMRDYKKLRAVLYKPVGFEKLPLILQRTCYPHNEEFYRIHAEELSKRGYAFLLEYCRGTGGSEGIWEPNINERQDGLDTLQWLETQDWVDCIGYWGDSYLALTGWVIADAVTLKVRSLCLGNYGTDRYTSAYEKRLFRHDVLTSWAMENAGYEIKADYTASCSYRPHEQVDEALWGKRLDWYRQWVTNTKREDAYWNKGFWKELSDIPAKVKIPVFLSEGWFDHHLGSALKTWNTLSETAKEHSRLDIGPLNHFGQNSIGSYVPKHLSKSQCPAPLEWFELTLKKKLLPKKTVNLYVIGEDRWKETSNWPCPDVEKWTLYLDGKKEEDAYETNQSGLYNGTISASPGEAQSSSYCYDPEKPQPSKGAEAMLHTMEEIGSVIQPEPGSRADVISFLSGIFEEDRKIFGKIKVSLFISTDVRDTAFTAKLIEVGPDKTGYNIRSSITTVAAEVEDYTPGTVAQVHIDMWDVIWTVRKGYRLRLDISSSDFPQYAVHSNFPGIWSRSSSSQKANQIIYYGGNTPSRIEIDILPEGS